MQNIFVESEMRLQSCPEEFAVAKLIFLIEFVVSDLAGDRSLEIDIVILWKSREF
jgi:hypothetical protein